MWQLDADHPDKNGLQLRKLAFVLKAAAMEEQPMKQDRGDALTLTRTLTLPRTEETL